jgi:hypothetical protein
MLKEIVNERLISERRRYFTDEHMDLFLWHDQEGNLSGLQVCFDKAYSERAYTWISPSYRSVAGVDQGEDMPYDSMTPILVPTDNQDKGVIIQEFRARSREMDPMLVG